MPAPSIQSPGQPEKNSMQKDMIDHLRHPSESSRYWLAVLATTPLLLLGLVLTFASFGVAVLGAVTAVAAVWFAVVLLEARYKANLVQVSEHNFPEVKAIVDECRHGLGYEPTVELYVQQGDANAFLYKFFSRKFMVVQADFIEEASRPELVWLIGRFVGMLKAKHDRLSLLTALVGVSEKFFFMNLFLYPYERAVVYSADQMGLFLSQDLNASLLALNRLVVGKNLNRHVTSEGLLQQRLAIRGRFLPWLARVMSTHPHHVDRHANLFRFAEQEMPQVMESYRAAPRRLPPRLFELPEPELASAA
jgi:Zn-dependent protease with chaperone function